MRKHHLNGIKKEFGLRISALKFVTMKLIPKNKVVKAVLLIILIVGLPLLLAVYELLFLSYYQETIANRRANYFVVPLLVISFIFVFIDLYKSYSKSESKKILPVLKKLLLNDLVITVIFLYILGSVISGTIIFINANIGHQTEETVEGLIIAKKDYNGSRSFEYKLTIQTDSEILVFDTDSKVITSHYKGDTFKERMTRGSLGLLYKR